MFINKTIAIIIALLVLVGCNDQKRANKEKPEVELTNVIQEFENKFVALSKETNLAYYAASVSGKDEDYKKWEELTTKQTKIYADKERFKKLDELKGQKQIKDELLVRQLDILWKDHKFHQVAPDLIEEIIKKETAVEKKFATYRAQVGEKKLTDNQIEEVLSSSKSNKELEAAWTASKKIGELVAKDVLELVNLRNRVAKLGGYDNYHSMSLALSEQDPKEIEKLFDELDELTRTSFKQVKDEIDTVLSKEYGIGKNEMMPWHYQNRFFQEAPQIYSVDLDSYYKDKDIVKMAEKFYSDIGLPVEDVLAKSDLYEKKGKQQHAYCTQIDREGDVRIFQNVKPNNRWMGTTLHELGHAVYSKYASMTKLPWLLREEAHIFTTEAIAMLMGRLSTNPEWIRRYGHISEQEAKKISVDSYKSLKLEQLVFSRWSQVMYRFEKAMYANPKQDLNALWWNLVKKYQLVSKPESRDAPDWASKIHMATVPAYYHNYHLGELLASQLNNYMVKNILKSDNYKYPDYSKTKEIGSYLKKKVFEVGKRYLWSDMIKMATGEKLTAKYYANQFVD